MAPAAPEPLAEPLIHTPEDAIGSLKEDRSVTAASWQQEAKQQLSLAVPIMGMNAVQLMLVLTSAAFVGHLGALELASAQLATSLANAMGHYLLVGMALGLETLGGQVVGAEQYEELGHVTHLGLIILTILAFSISLLWAFAEPLLLGLGQDATLAANAARYLHLLIPSLFANAWTQPLVKFLQSQGATAPLAWASTVTLVLHVPSNWFFIYYLNWGLAGAAIATSLAFCSIFLLLAVHILTSGAYVRSTPKLNLSRSFRKAPIFLKLGFFSASMLCLEYIAFDIVYLLAGLLPDPYRLVSALSVAMNTIWLCAASYVGLGNAVSTRVATELGRKSVPRAQKAALVGLSLAFCVGGCATVLILALHKWVPLLFIDGSDRKLLELSAGIMLIASFAIFGDAVQTIAGAIIRGCGRQTLGALVTLGSYYVIGLPVSYLLGFVWNWGVWGLFGGSFVFGIFSQLVFFMIAVARMDWQHQVDLAQHESVEEKVVRAGGVLS